MTSLDETRPAASDRSAARSDPEWVCGTASDEAAAEAEGDRLHRALRLHGGDLARRGASRVRSPGESPVRDGAHLVDERERRDLEPRGRGGDGRWLHRHG